LPVGVAALITIAPRNSSEAVAVKGEVRTSLVHVKVLPLPLRPGPVYASVAVDCMADGMDQPRRAVAVSAALSSSQSSVSPVTENAELQNCVTVTSMYTTPRSTCPLSTIGISTCTGPVNSVKRSMRPSPTILSAVSVFLSHTSITSSLAGRRVA